MSEKEISAGLLLKKLEERIPWMTRLIRSDIPQRKALLIARLEDKAPYIAAMAAEALKECAEWEDGPVLTAHFERLTKGGVKADPGCHVRAHLAIALAKAEYRLGADVLREGIRTVQIEPVGGVPFDTAAHLRANCALALAQVHAPDSVRDIALLLFDTSGNAISGERNSTMTRMEPRKAAAQALALLGDPTGLVPLAIRLTYPGNEAPEALATCMESVVALGDERALELLTPYLKHRDQMLAAHAALMVARTQRPEAAELIAETIWLLAGDARRATLLALITVRTEEADQVWKRLEDEADKQLLAMMKAVREEIA